VGDSRVAARPEKTIYYRISTVGLDPHGEALDPCTCRPNPRIRSRTSTGVPRPLGWAPDPPLCRVRTTLSKVPGQNMHRPWIGPKQGSGDDTCPDPVWCGPVRLGHCSSHGWRPDAATWPTTRDVSRRAELDVRPPGYAAPTFIADKARRLSVLLTGEVPPQHLMSPVYSAGRDVPPRYLMCLVHSTGRRRPSRPAGGVPVRSGGRQYACAAAYTMLIITRTLPVKLPLHADTMQVADIRAQEECTSDWH
jgi:hypothetical protein